MASNTVTRSMLALWFGVGMASSAYAGGWSHSSSDGASSSASSSSGGDVSRELSEHYARVRARA